jgi:peptidoglycan/xylan/chitin deacetylase (PgdA/CDA1 family)
MNAPAWWHRTPVWRPLLHGGVWSLPAELATLGGTGRVLLTFDDGPSPATAQVAETLARHGARAQFFLLGSRLDNSSSGAREAVSITRDLLAAGHLPAVHGWEHGRAALQAPGDVVRDARRAADAIAQACGMAPLHYRPPYGSWAPWLSSAPRRAGLCLQFWSFNPFDYKPHTAAGLARLCGDNLRAGDILLLHCTGRGQDVTQQALPELLERLRGRGLAPLDPLALLETGHG